jgi:4-carboxymuconolactone decarboxylase
MQTRITRPWAGLVTLLAPFLAAGAQDRMPPIAADELSAAQQAAVAEHRTMRNTEIRGGPWVPLLRSPEVMRRARAMGDYLRFNSALPPRLSEFVILMTAREWTQQYEWYVHYDIALEAGLDPEVARAVAEGRRPAMMAENEAILYAFFTELNRNRSVSDETYARALAEFGEQGVIDTLGIIGYYTLLAMVMNTARTPLPANADPALAPLP